MRWTDANATFQRELSAALASDNQLGLDDNTQWRPLEHDRHWFVRSLDFDAHLSQLCGEPLGSLQLLSSTPLP